MIDPTTNEITAMEAASGAAGEYVDNLSKTDMATFTESEWMCLIECIVTSYCDKLRELQKDDPPF